VDVNISIDVGDYNKQPNKRLVGVYIAPKFDDEGKRYAWMSYEEL
jgi:hypothetical protein